MGNPGPLTSRAVFAVVLVAAVAIGIAVVRPFSAPPIGPDAAAPVIEWQRLLAGQRLEGYLSQTSKPLLTVIYGIAHGMGGWTAVSLLAILSYALFASLASVLAWRTAGARVPGLAAAGFAGAGLILSPVLLTDVGFAYGVSWAMLACTIAGLAVTQTPRRFGVAGVALAAGVLARPEVLAVIALALAVIGAAVVMARLRGVAGPPRSAWLLAIGFAAIPILCLHDWALTGDALFWLNAAQDNTAVHGTVRSLAGMIKFVARDVLHLGLPLVLATFAAVVLVLRRRPVELVVISVVPVAVAAFYIASGARGTSISVRYLMPIDLGLVLAAGVGLGLLVDEAGRRITTRRPIRTGVAAPAAAVLGAAIAVLLAPVWPLHDIGPLRTQQASTANAERAFAELARVMPPVPSWRGQPVPSDAGTIVLLPRRLRAQAVVDLGLPLWASNKSSARLVALKNGKVAPGTIVYHDAHADLSRPAWRALEVSEPTKVGTRLVVPLYTDPAAGIWIVRADAAP
jgi:hypothetical protein